MAENKLSNYIDGKLEAPLSKEYLDNFEPATAKIYSQVPASNSQDVERAVGSAKKAFALWSRTSAQERSRFLRKIANGIAARKDEFIHAESIDTGKPVSLVRSLDIPRSIQNFEFFADATTQFSSECHKTDGDALNYTTREALGIVGCISPWNLPLYLFSWKIAPALAAGNCVVAKPSEMTPMTAWLLSTVCIESGLPAGVLNIVHGLGPQVGGALSGHSDVKAISFTGSTKTGATIAATAGPSFKKISLEMGGKNPALIFADCDFEKTVSEAVRFSFLNQGQICLCGSRLYIEESIYPKFKAAFIEKAKQLRQGDPLEEATEQGALVSKAHFEKVSRHFEVAKKEGGKVLLGGNTVKMAGRCADGWFFAPSIFEGLALNSETNQTEIFGPIVTLTPFKNEAEAIEMANGTRYGLASTVWTKDLTRAHRVAMQIDSGIVWINCWMLRDLRTPFGGFRDSGIGREGGWDALKFFTDSKNVCVKL